MPVVAGDPVVDRLRVGKGARYLPALARHLKEDILEVLLAVKTELAAKPPLAVAEGSAVEVRFQELNVD